MQYFQLRCKAGFEFADVLHISPAVGDINRAFYQ